MKELLASVTSKGQVTIPAEVRTLLGVSPYDKVAFVVEDGTVRLQRRGSIVAETAGALRSVMPARSARDMRVAAEESIAREVMERS